MLGWVGNRAWEKEAVGKQLLDKVDPLLAGEMHRNLNIQAQGEQLNSNQAMACSGRSDLSSKMGVVASDFGNSGQLPWCQGQTWS